MVDSQELLKVRCEDLADVRLGLRITSHVAVVGTLLQSRAVGRVGALIGKLLLQTNTDLNTILST